MGGPGKSQKGPQKGLKGGKPRVNTGGTRGLALGHLKPKTRKNTSEGKRVPMLENRTKSWEKLWRTRGRDEEQDAHKLGETEVERGGRGPVGKRQKILGG